MRQTAAHCWQNVVYVVASAEVQRLKPAFLTPDWCFVPTDSHDVELTAFSCDVSCNTLTQNTLFQSDPLNFDTSLFFELRCQLLHFDHVTVVYSSDNQFSTSV